MSIKCQIGFYQQDEKDYNNFDALIYRHWDGEPENVIADIEPILKDFDRNKGLKDTEYASAWLVAKLKTDYTNIGISKDFHADIEFFYAVFPNRIEFFKIDLEKLPTKPGEDIKPALKKIRTVNLK